LTAASTKESKTGEAPAEGVADQGDGLVHPDGGEPVAATRSHAAGLWEATVPGASMPLRYGLEVTYGTDSFPVAGSRMVAWANAPSCSELIIWQPEAAGDADRAGAEPLGAGLRRGRCIGEALAQSQERVSSPLPTLA